MSERRMDLLRVENLRISFDIPSGPITAVKNANLRILPGKVTALVGESGSGKSVISQAIMGILPKNARAEGMIRFSDPDGKVWPLDLLKLKPNSPAFRDLKGQRIANIFQEPMTSLSPLHTIGDQISEVLAIHTDYSRSKRREETEEMLGLVGFADPARAFTMYPFELSGGMRQRAMIAMALICRPALLIADEPTTALDVTIQAQILKLLRDLQSQFGMAILLITHDLGVVANMADEVVVIYRGEIMEAGPVDAIFCQPGHPYLKGLMAAVPHFDMKPGERLKPLRSIAVGSAGLLGKPRRTGVKGKTPVPDVILSVRHVSKTFPGGRKGLLGTARNAPHRAVGDVSFDVRRGECLGLVGESGCGKTTLSKILMRAVSADEGSVVLNSREGQIDVLNASGGELRRLRTRMQMVFQDPVSSLSPRMTVQNILMEPLEIHRRGTAQERMDMVRRLVHAIGLDETALNRYPHSFSGGQRQRIGIARALALQPDLIICDEPVSALDVSVQAQILNLLKDLQQDLGLTMIFISHNLAVVDYMADRIAVMCQGEIVEIAPREELMRRPVHPYTRALLSAVPFPDLDRRLDLNHLSLLSASDSSLWPAAFQRAEGEQSMEIREISRGHGVLVRPGASLEGTAP